MESKLQNLIANFGTLPVFFNNNFYILGQSKMADLTIIGFHKSSIKTKGIEQINQHNSIGNVLFVNTLKNKMIK